MDGAAWRKSSYSGNNGGQCVEVAAIWRTSSYSGNNGGECVEVAGNWQKSNHSGNNGGDCVEVLRDAPGLVAVRDSKDPQGPKLAFAPAQWHRFAASIKAGKLGTA